MTVFLPDAEPMDFRSIKLGGRLRESNDLLEHLDALNERYEADGYLFFRSILPIEAVDQAREAMMAPLLEQGVIDREGRWIGGEAPSPAEESPLFQGVWKSLFEYPGVKAALDRLLGEETEAVPIVQYRAYAPHDARGGVHQDGFHTPGVANYRPVWIPLIDMEEEVGGLALAVGQNKNGFYHNLAQQPRCPVPEGVIDPTSWATIDYRRGDVLVVHPHTPHTGMPNRSDRVRFSIDSRVQSAANPATVMGAVTAFDLDSVTLRVGSDLTTLQLSDDTFIRIGEDRGRRMSRTEFVEEAREGVVLMASRDGDRALMLRRAAAG